MIQACRRHARDTPSPAGRDMLHDEHKFEIIVFNRVVLRTSGETVDQDREAWA
jgi:hypothetical protein